MVKGEILNCLGRISKMVFKIIEHKNAQKLLKKLPWHEIHHPVRYSVSLSHDEVEVDSYCGGNLHPVQFRIGCEISVAKQH